MYELNNKEDKKKKSGKKITSIIIIFIMICIVIVIFSILKYKSLSNQIFNSSIISTLIPNKSVEKKPVKLTDKAKFNGITEKTEKESYGEQIDYYEYDDESVMKLEIQYVQIEGLKNRDIQDKINNIIKNEVDEIKEKRIAELNNEDISKMSINALVYGDFADVLSICVTESIDYDYGNENYEYVNNEYGLNFSLETGDFISFKDMFWEDSPVRDVLSESLCKSLAWQYDSDVEDFDHWELNMDDVDYSAIQSKVNSFMNKYDKNQDINFYFTASDIIVPNVEDETCYLNMADFFEEVAIYTKYKSNKNLYERDPELREFYVFSDHPMYPQYYEDTIIESGYKFDNIYFNLYCYENYKEMTDEEKKSLDMAKNEIYNRLNEYAEKLKMNREHGYIIEGIYMVGSEDEGKLGYSIDMQIAQCSKEYFDNHLEDALAAGARHTKTDVSADNYSYIDEENFEFYESCSEWSDDYTDENAKKINIYTKEDKLEEERLWEEETENAEQQSS